MMEGILPTMRRALLAAVVTGACGTVGLSGQLPAVVDTSKLGPQVGAVAPAFAGVDQFGTSRSLASSYGPKGVMLVFFRSADW